MATTTPQAPRFATPLPQSSRSEVLEWRFPKPHQQLVLTGKSRAAWHTSFVVPQLNLLLDAGLCVNRLRPKHIFLTHGHSDHALLAPAFVKREDPPDIYCPAELKDIFNEFILSTRLLNKGGLVGRDDYPLGDPPGDLEQGADWRGTHVTYGMRHGDVALLRRLKGISAEAFDCDHSVPCVGYVFAQTTSRLRLEYASLAPQELRALRESGTEITAPHKRPIFAFLGDTTAATLAAAPGWLTEGVPVVITECSFLYEEHKAQARKTKHTLWSDLEPVVRQWPKTTFVLMHFSMRYTDDQIRRFFAEMQDPPANIVVWVDGQPEMEAA